MNEISRNPIFIQDQRLSRLVLRPEDRGDKLEHLRAQHGGEAWEPREELERLTNDQRCNQPRWQTVSHRLELFSQFESRDRVLLAVTAYAGIGKSMVLHQIDGLLSSACEGMDVVRVEFSDLPDDWEKYLHKPCLGDDPFLVRVISDQLSKHAEDNSSLPPIDKKILRDWLAAKIRTGAFVLLVDGLDEYNDPSATKKAKQLRHLLFEVFPKFHCVVAGRPHAITNELWLSLFSDSPESTKNSPCSDWQFLRVEMFDREQLERFLGEEMADQLKVLEAEIEFSPRNLEALRTLDETTRASIQSTADLYWHSIVCSLPRDNRESMGEKLLHTNLNVNEIMHMFSAIGITMALWHDDPRYPTMESPDSNEFGANIPIPKQDADSVKKTKSNPGVMEIGGANSPPMEVFRERVFERLLEVYPTWSNFESTTKRSVAELRYEELVRLNSQYVEFGFFVEQQAIQVRWRNATLRDFFAALWMSSRANECERDALHRRMDIARDERDSSIAATWQMICGMPPGIGRLCAGVNETERNLPWLRMIYPLYLSADKEKRFNGRPTELLYRAWPGLLYRAGFLGSLAWTEYDLLMATTIAQRNFDPKVASCDLTSETAVKDVSAWRITGSFLQQYPLLRDRTDEKAAIVTLDLENQQNWCQCLVESGELSDTDYSQELIPLRSYLLSLTHVTVRLYALFDSPPSVSAILSQRLGHVSIMVNWYDAMAFCIWSHSYMPSGLDWLYARREDRNSIDNSITLYYWRDECNILNKYTWQPHHLSDRYGEDDFVVQPLKIYAPPKCAEVVGDTEVFHAMERCLSESFWVRDRYSMVGIGGEDEAVFEQRKRAVRFSYAAVQPNRDSGHPYSPLSNGVIGCRVYRVLDASLEIGRRRVPVDRFENRDPA